MPTTPTTRALSSLAAACASLSLMAMAAPASAATYAFMGAQANMDAPTGPDLARCGGRVSVTIGNSPGATSFGVSNLGAFSTEQSHCLTPPLPTSYDLGEFEYTFASGDTLFGSYTGDLTFSSPGVFNNLQSFVVTGGTGLFAGATGGFNGTGYVNFLGPAPMAALTFAGEITTRGGAVPEPAAWAMLILGFGGAGTVLRRRRALVAA